jgi:hypothetical protein
MKKTRVTKNCVICGKPFEVKLSHASYIQCCSYICGNKFRQQKFDKKLEALIGTPINDWLLKYYLGQFQTYRQICNELKINTRTLMRYMRQFNIPVRRGGEAIKTQWINNIARKQAQAEFIKSIPHPYCHLP